MSLEKLIEQNPHLEFLKADGFDNCVIGYEIETNRLIYDVDKMIEKLQDDIPNRDTALEYLEYNVLGAYVGEHTPIYMQGLE